jgi:hypothetical protein
MTLPGASALAVPGTIGLAWVGTICSSQYGAGVSSWNPTHWLTVARTLRECADMTACSAGMYTCVW